MEGKKAPSKIELRAVIRFLTLSSKSVNEISTDMELVYGTDTPSRITIAFWASRFRAGRTSLEDEERTGRPVDQGSVEAVRDYIDEERDFSVREISKITTVPVASVHGILTERLGL